MKWLSRASGLVVMAALASASLVGAVDIWTVGVNNTRQGWNRFETVLTPANVPKLKKIREFMVDEKIDVSPLIVGDKLYVFTMTNTAFVFDVNTGAQLATRQLAPPFDPRRRPRDGWTGGYIYSKLGHHRDAGHRRRHEHDLRHDVWQTERRRARTPSATTCSGCSTRTRLPTDSRRCSSPAMPTTAAAGSPTASPRRIRSCAPASDC